MARWLLEDLQDENGLWNLDGTRRAGNNVIDLEHAGKEQMIGDFLFVGRGVPLRSYIDYNIAGEASEGEMRWPRCPPAVQIAQNASRKAPDGLVILCVCLTREELPESCPFNVPRTTRALSCRRGHNVTAHLLCYPDPF